MKWTDGRTVDGRTASSTSDRMAATLAASSADRMAATFVASAELVDKARRTLVSTRGNELVHQRPAETLATTIYGFVATELICFSYMRDNGECTCNGTKAHILKTACGGAVSAALGGRHVCKRKASRPCRFWHPDEQLVKAELLRWFLSTPEGIAAAAAARESGSDVWSHTTSTISAADAFSDRHPPRSRQATDNGACKGGVRSEATSAASTHHGTAVHASARATHAYGDGDSDASEAEEGQIKRCTVPVSVQLARIAKHRHESRYVDRFLREPFLPSLLEDEALRSLLSMRTFAKEVSEAYGAAHQVLELLRHWRGAGVGDAGGQGLAAAGVDGTTTTTAPPSGGGAARHAPAAAAGEDAGGGVTILDVCCGKGLTSVLLSYLLPEARLLLLDSNGAMEMAHVARRPTMSFVQLDLFAADALGKIEAAVAAAAPNDAAIGDDAAAAVGTTTAAAAAAASTRPRCVIAVGTHLCGSLSPRLIDVALRLPAVDALVLSPCCLRGALGAQIKSEARRGWPGVHDGAYHLLAATLAALCRAELTARGLRAAGVAATTAGVAATTAGVAATTTAGVAATGGMGMAAGGGGDGVHDPAADEHAGDARAAARPAAEVEQGAPPPSPAPPTLLCRPCEGEESAGGADATIPDLHGPADGEASRPSPSVRVTHDTHVLSPRNAFIVVRKR